jgi:hypothetical protein
VEAPAFLPSASRVLIGDKQLRPNRCYAAKAKDRMSHDPRDPRSPLQREWLPVRGPWLITLLLGLVFLPWVLGFASWLWLVLTGFC